MSNVPVEPPVHGSQSPRARGEEKLLASVTDYVDAQALVDRMSDDGFPVEHLRIVGDGVRTVENVTGRMTKTKAALGGAATGAWFGLLIGLLLGLFTVGTTAWFWIILVSVLLGVVWGAALGAIAHSMTRGKRDFSSVMSLRAQRYDVYVAADHADQAARYTTQA